MFRMQPTSAEQLGKSSRFQLRCLRVDKSRQLPCETHNQFFYDSSASTAFPRFLGRPLTDAVAECRYYKIRSVAVLKYRHRRLMRRKSRSFIVVEALNKIVINLVTVHRTRLLSVCRVSSTQYNRRCSQRLII